MFLNLNEFELFEKIQPPNTEFVGTTLAYLKKNFFDNLYDIDEGDIIDFMNEAFKKYKIEFVVPFKNIGNFREISNREWSTVGISGAITDLYGNILIIILPKFFENFDKQYADRYFNKFIKILKQVISHELIHRYQIEKMDKKYLKILSDRGAGSLKDKEYPYLYYSDTQEIMAFAEQTINDLLNHNFSKKDIIKFLKSPNLWLGDDFDKWDTERNFTKYSMTYIIYYKLFRDSDSKIWNRFLKNAEYFLNKKLNNDIKFKRF